MSENIYILSEAADQDLENIFDFTLNQFGFDQAEKYLLEIEDLFKILVLHPESSKARNEIKEGLYSFRKIIISFSIGYWINKFRLSEFSMGAEICQIIFKLCFQVT